MRHPFISLFFLPLLLVSCNQPEPEPKDPEGTVYYTSHDSVIANPERGIYVQAGYHSTDLNKKTSAATLLSVRQKQAITIYLHMYYLEEYKDCLVPQEYLDRFAANMQALREGGAKAVVRFAYSDGYDPGDKPWDASTALVSQHIDQFAPLLREYADVIFCVQAGFVGSWGEWYYTDNFVSQPKTQEQFQLRRELLDHLLEVMPATRQVAVRTPEYKKMYLDGTYSDYLTEYEAHNGTPKARICGHNDCFLSSANDVGTYNGPDSRTFWNNDSKYTFMGGESCAFVAALANGDKALERLAESHWDYLHRDYYKQVLTHWETTGYLVPITNRLGYRFVMDKAYWTPQPHAGELFKVDFTLHNEGFSAPKNPRDVELVFVNIADSADRFIYPQSLDPRFWMGGDTITSQMHCTLDPAMAGTYRMYINLPDPCETLHTNPLFSIRLANVGMWDEKDGYNLMGEVSVQ